MKYEFIEIGTSDFRTLAQSTISKGISVEPVKHYLDRLPNRDNLIKVNKAISDTNGYVDVYYVDSNKIMYYNYPNWLRGCNSINNPHPTVTKFCLDNNVKDLVIVEQVETITLFDLFAEHNVTEIDFLKIDTEGHDVVIMNYLLDMENQPTINKIQFESNVLTNPNDLKLLYEKAKIQGWKIQRLETDTILTK